ncbi:MAG TPA: hypothetical protein DEA73_08455 [Peptococcaceae bacterium]|nr:hypothetical protein [Peptococcaceae bacterium]
MAGNGDRILTNLPGTPPKLEAEGKLGLQGFPERAEAKQARIKTGDAPGTTALDMVWPETLRYYRTFIANSLVRQGRMRVFF